MKNWKTERLDDLCVLIADCPHSTPVWTDSGALVLRSQNIRNGRLDLSLRSYTDEVHFEQRSRRAKLRAGDLVITREAPMGEICLIPEGLRCCLGQRMVMLRPDVRKCDSRFLLYAIQSDAVQHEIRISEGTGSTVSNLRIPLLKALPIPFPPIPEQKAIAHVLGTLDDKIELNRRMNATLEAMAQALFKSWFVDFDPVKAKAAGRAPEGMDADTAALFPREFVQSELGLIPKGWEIGSILTQAKLLSGGTPKTERPDYWNGNVQWASAKDVSQANQAFLIETERTITDKGLKESATQLIPALGTVIVARGATTGRMVLFGKEMAMNQTCYALISSIGTPLALHCQLRRTIDVLVHAAHGSVFNTITTNTFSTSKTVLPSAETLQSFERIASPIFEKILTNTEECLSLATIRDALLPKLISGQLRIPEAEARAEAAL